ncbi:class C sortase [Vagococcus bubulae]|uniref:Class C sortase n=1 Tax=Vagococcus bubulae TaxID=1977868 RepID=A0A429ZBY0_9ENTE|nr:class C sortase [Vagococcus bubulae]RST91208.1 hypothetical protein CBF36_10315 [Vagococcus bubulae]
MKKKIIVNGLFMIMFLLGFLVMTYPFYINELNNVISQYNMRSYQKEDDKIYSQQAKEFRERNSQLSEEGIHIGGDPFDESSDNNHKVDKKKYLIGKINIPKLSIQLPLFGITTPYLLEYGATVLDGTSLPVGGENTHSVISAHRGLPNRELFTNLTSLKENDVFLIELKDDTLAYQVESIKVVTPDQTDSIEIVPGEDLVTLLTCTPYMVNTHRLLVTGHRIEYTEKVKKDENGGNKIRLLKMYGIIILLLLFLLTTFIYIVKTITMFILSKKNMTLSVRVFSKDFDSPFIVSLYSKNGHHPMYRDGTVYEHKVYSDDIVTFKNIPRGLYRLKINDTLTTNQLGIRKIKQTQLFIFNKNKKYTKKRYGKYEIEVI